MCKRIILLHVSYISLTLFQLADIEGVATRSGQKDKKSIYLLQLMIAGLL